MGLIVFKFYHNTKICRLACYLNVKLHRKCGVVMRSVASVSVSVCLSGFDVEKV